MSKNKLNSLSFFSPTSSSARPPLIRPHHSIAPSLSLPIPLLLRPRGRWAILYSILALAKLFFNRSRVHQVCYATSSHRTAQWSNHASSWYAKTCQDMAPNSTALHSAVHQAMQCQTTPPQHAAVQPDTTTRSYSSWRLVWMEESCGQ